MSVYFMRQVGTDLVKIGRSSSPLRRRGEVRWMHECLDNVVVERVVQLHDDDLDSWAEMAAHGLASDSHIERELFRLDTEGVESVARGLEALVSSIQEHAAKHAVNLLLAGREHGALSLIDRAGHYGVDALVTVTLSCGSAVQDIVFGWLEKTCWSAGFGTALEITEL